MKQYIKNKPIKWWFKIWMHCDSITGYLYEFDIYTGRKSEPELGLGETVVLDVTKKLTGTCATIYTCNYFSSPTLAVRLQNSDIFFVGIVRKDQMGLLEFTGDKKRKEAIMRCFSVKMKI